MEVGNNSVETHVVSQVSRTRAANGDSNLSAETLKAVADGAVAPQVVQQVADEVKVSDETQNLADNIRQAAEETADVQSVAPPAIEDDAVIVELSNVAANLAAEEAPVETTEPVADPEQTEPVDVIAQSNTDTASVALGNAIDIKV